MHFLKNMSFEYLHQKVILQRNGPLYSEHETLIECIFGFKVGFLQQQIFPLRWVLSQHRIGNWLQMRKWSKCVLKHKSGTRSRRFNRNPFKTSQYTSVCACITLCIFISMCVDNWTFIQPFLTPCAHALCG